MRTVARIVFLVVGVGLLCQIVPNFYDTATRQVVRTPYFSYSTVENKLLVRRYLDEEAVHMDLEGNVYSERDYERVTPLRHHAQLARDGRMPETIGGIRVNQHLILRERTYIRIRPESFETGLVNLRPLFESESGRVNLEMPTDLMRLDDAVTFYIPAENRIDEDKSAHYTDVLEAAGVVFPVVRYGSFPTTRKPFDEGFIFEDAAGALFSLRQVQGEPEVALMKDLGLPEQAKMWEQLRPKLIEIQEQANRAIRAVIVDQADRIWLVAGDFFRLVPIEMATYEPANSRLLIRGNLLTFSVMVRSPEGIEVVILDRDFNELARHSEFVPGRDDFAWEAADWLFPLRIDYRNRHSNYLGLFVGWGQPWAFGISGLMALGYLGWARWTHRWRAVRLVDALVIVLSGWLGLVMALAIPPTHARHRR